MPRRRTRWLRVWAGRLVCVLLAGGQLARCGVLDDTRPPAPDGLLFGHEVYFFDRGFAAALAKFFAHEPRARSVLDIGAGPGRYVGVLAAMGLEAHGVDANPALFGSRAALLAGLQPAARAALEFSLSLVQRHDIASALPGWWRFDWVMSLEVAEHLAPEREVDFLLNLHRHNTEGVILSWASRGQAGPAHVNTRDAREVVALFTALGYARDEDVETALREASNLEWYRENILVFRRLEPLLDLNTMSTVDVMGKTDHVPDSPAVFQAVTNLNRKYIQGQSFYPDQGSCCADRNSMDHLIKMSHFLACFRHTRTTPCAAHCDTYAGCCQPEVEAECFANGTVYAFSECCNEDTEMMWHAYDQFLNIMRREFPT